jgi:hypothetical protein
MSSTLQLGRALHESLCGGRDTRLLLQLFETEKGTSIRFGSTCRSPKKFFQGVLWGGGTPAIHWAGGISPALAAPAATWRSLSMGGYLD